MTTEQEAAARWRSRIVGSGEEAPDQLLAHPDNWRIHTAAQQEAMSSVLDRVGFVQAVIVNRTTGRVLDGHMRVALAISQGEPAIPVTYVELAAEEERLVLATFDPLGAMAIPDEEKLRELLADESELGDFLPDVDDELAGALARAGRTEPAPGKPARAKSTPLASRFVIPPFSVFDARQGYWQDRKRQWLGLGIQSEVGREENALGMSETVLEASGSLNGTSVFDPVLCEVAYRWWCPPEGAVLDPFAGGSVRGLLAGLLGRPYTGIELRPEQVNANREQLEAIAPDAPARWLLGDARILDKLIPKRARFDFLFSCPPYFDLEVYSDDPADLSNADGYEPFLEAYREIVAAAVGRLKTDRFACFVVSEIRERDERGFYRGFVQDTIQAFEDAGAGFYNEAILINATGTLPLRAARIFGAGRKLGRTHQNVLVFCKGDPRKATAAIGPVEVTDPETLETVEV